MKISISILLIWLATILLIVYSVINWYKLLFSFFQKKHRYEQTLTLKFLHIKIPKNSAAKSWDISANDHIQTMKNNIDLMNQVLKNIYAIYDENTKNKWFWNNFVSLEVFVEHQVVKFVVAVPADHVETVEKSISSFYPWSVIELVNQPKYLDEGKYIEWWELVLKKSNAYPIKIYDTFEADPMDSLFAAYARVEYDEKLCLQVLLSPLHEKWSKKLRKEVSDVKDEVETWMWSDIKFVFNKIFWIKKKDDDKKSHTFSAQQSWDLDKKVEDELFEVKVRVFAVSPDAKRADILIQDIYRSFQQYNYVGLNWFSLEKTMDPIGFAKSFVLRSMYSNNDRKYNIQHYWKICILNIKEISSFIHFPHSRFNRSPRIQWQKYKIIAAPDNIPTEWLYLWDNLYAWIKRKIYIKPKDRFRHFYIIWQTGTWKSTMMDNMVVQDMRNWNWFCVIDPHGQLCDNTLPYLPKERLDDLIYFDLSNTAYPIWFNPFEAETEEEKDIVTNDLIEMFVGMYGQEIFWPRIQDYFINASFLLMSQPDWGTLPEVMRLFTDDAFLESKLKHLTNPVIMSWWRKTYSAMWDREKKEIIPYMQSKFSWFTNGVYIRNVIWQPKTAFNFTKAMQENKMIFCNLSKWLTWEINSQLIGRMFAMQIKIHALRRASIPEEDRKPFFLYVDEFQNYVSKSFESILSEARKYRLGVCIAHQYIDQLKAWSLWWNIDLSKPIFGNVWNQLYLKVWPEDAEFLEKNIEPEFSKSDLISLDKFKWIMTLSVDTQPSRPFSITPYYIHSEKPEHNMEKYEIIKQISALRWWTKRELAEKEIFYRVWV